MKSMPISSVSAKILNGEPFRSLLANVPDAMVIIDEKGIVLLFSTAAERMFGYSQSEVVGENVSMLMPSPDRERHDSYLHNYRETGIRKIIGIGRVTIARRRDGSTFPIELSVSEASVEGQPLFTGFIHDVTQGEKIDVRLRNLQAEIAYFGRLSELGTLASSLAHELNQPLTALASYCEGAIELLEGTPDQSGLEIARGALRDAVDQALRAGQIVKRMRNFLSHGDVEHMPESLTRLVAEANALALVGTRELGLDVQVHLDPNCDDVFVDKIQIQQVLFNLIRNSVEAMLDSSVRSLVISSVPGPGGVVILSVEDSGTGLDDAVAAQLFEPFVTTKTGGMGIGLSICRTIVESHGGKMWFEAGPDGGSIFRFTIPQAGVEDDQF